MDALALETARPGATPPGHFDNATDSQSQHSTSTTPAQLLSKDAVEILAMLADALGLENLTAADIRGVVSDPLLAEQVVAVVRAVSNPETAPAELARLDELLPPILDAAGRAVGYDPCTIVVPAAKLARLMCRPNARKLWEASGEEPNLAQGKLVALAREHGFREPETVALLNAWRADRGLEPLPYGESLAFVRDCDKAGQRPQGDQLDGKPGIAAVGRPLGLELADIIKRGRVGGDFELRLKDGRVIGLGGAASLLSFAQVSAAFVDAGLVAPAAGLRHDWRSHASRIALAARVVEVPGEAEVIEELLERYLESRQRVPVGGDWPRDAVILTEDGRVHVRLSDFLRWASLSASMQVSHKRLATVLSTLGWTSTQLSRRPPGSKESTKARVWAAPDRARGTT